MSQDQLGFVDLVKYWLVETPVHKAASELEELQCPTPVPSSDQLSLPKAKSKSKKRRARTTLQFAQPPPRPSSSSLSLTRSNNLIVQLQETLSCDRPQPAFDVVFVSGSASPIQKLSTTLRRRQQSIGGIEIIRREPCQSSQTSSSQPSGEESSQSSEPQERYGHLIKNRDDATWHISLNDGSVWACKRGPHGSYTVTKKGAESPVPLIAPLLSARWDLRKQKQRKHRGSSEESPSSPEYESSFRFCPNDTHPNWRPFAATLNSKRMQVFDTYKVHLWPDADAEIPETDEQWRSAQVGRHIVKTTDQLEALAVISGVWVAIQEGWIGKAFFGELEELQEEHEPEENQVRDRAQDAIQGGIQDPSQEQMQQQTNQDKPKAGVNTKGFRKHKLKSPLRSAHPLRKAKGATIRWIGRRLSAVNRVLSKLAAKASAAE